MRGIAPEDTATCDSDAQSQRHLTVAVHIRYPEDYCTDTWKQANSIDHPLDTLERMTQCLESLALEVNMTIDVYTEESFPHELEQDFGRRLEKFLVQGSVVHFHRQTPLLSTVQGMATADVFVPASSYLSAMAAFFSNSLVVLPDEETRRTQYFAPHLKEGCPTRIVQAQHTELLTQALAKVCRVQDER